MKRIAFILALLFGGIAHGQVALFTCSNAQSITLTGTTAAGSVQMIAAPNLGRGANIYLCSTSLQVTEGATPATFQLVTGTGTNCGTSQTPLTLAATGTANSTPSFGAAYTSDSAVRVPTNQAVCVVLSNTVTTSSFNLRWVVQ